jgi:hypothetical protein
MITRGFSGNRAFEKLAVCWVALDDAQASFRLL